MAPKKLLPEKTVELCITSMSHEGRGIARLENKTIFVFGALLGEVVKAKYLRSHSRFDEAYAVEIVHPSSDRVMPACPHFGVCGGCQWQHASPSAQIRYKEAHVRERLLHAKITPRCWAPPLMGAQTGYRQKARLGVRYVLKKEALLLGFREQKNNKIAILSQCAILDARVGERILALRSLLASLKGKESIVQMEVAIGEEEVGLIFRHIKPLDDRDISVLLDFCKENGFSLYLQPEGLSSVHKLWPATPLLLSYTLPDFGLLYHFHPCDFIQVNQNMNQKMIHQALAWLSPHKQDTVLDLFCGLGNFSLPFAQRVKKVVGVEGIEEMVKRARNNASTNNLDNVSFFVGDLEAEDTYLEWNHGDISHWATETYTQLILDPPRTGALHLMQNIHRFHVPSILYVSCNSATFVRDAEILVHQQGYTLEKIGVLDMFPHTAHVEIMALFTRNVLW